MRARWKTLLLYTTALAGLAAATVFGVHLYVFRTGQAMVAPLQEVRPAQAAVVLGAMVYPDGRVSDMVADRLHAALALYREGKVQKLLITGDHGQVEYDEVNTMRRWLEREGVPSADIFMDHAGFDTYNSMYRARSVFQVHSAVVVTQAFHLPRALYLADRLGLTVQGVVADRWRYRDAWWYDLREAGARNKAFLNVLVHRKPTFLGPVIPISGDGRQTHDQPK